MIFEKKVVEMYKNTSFVRCDDDGTASYFSYLDFPGLKQEKYLFKSSMGHELQGYLYNYDNYEAKKIVIFDHGFGGGHRSYMKEIEMLCKNDFLVFAYDHTGCMESGGENTNGMAQSLCDLNDCLNVIKAYKRFENYEICVMGHSWGGFSTLNISSLHKEISKIVVMSGFVSVKHIVESNFKGFLKGYRKAIMKLESEANPKFVEYNAINSLKSSGVKALLIYSDNDHLCHKDVSYDLLYSEFKNSENVKFILENNKWHNPNYTKEAVEYLNSYVGKKTELMKKGLLVTKEQKKEFISSYDWDKMTKQDDKVWNEIISWLK